MTSINKNEMKQDDFVCVNRGAKASIKYFQRKEKKENMVRFFKTDFGGILFAFMEAHREKYDSAHEVPDEEELQIFDEYLQEKNRYVVQSVREIFPCRDCVTNVKYGGNFKHNNCSNLADKLLERYDNVEGEYVEEEGEEEEYYEDEEEEYYEDEEEEYYEEEGVSVAEEVVLTPDEIAVQTFHISNEVEVKIQRDQIPVKVNPFSTLEEDESESEDDEVKVDVEEVKVEVEIEIPEEEVPKVEVPKTEDSWMDEDPSEVPEKKKKKGKKKKGKK